MKKKKWIISERDDSLAKELSQKLGIPYLTATVLAGRGLKTPEQAASFMDSSLNSVFDPFLLTDMQKAADTIEESIRLGEKIAIYGDYDVDGVTATCIMIRYLRSRGADCTYYIPDRLGEGYGLNLSAIKTLYEEGCRLLITVDSGITAVPEAEYAESLGLKLIITDHHECKEVLPSACAVINPRREGEKYPFHELAGVGVAFKLICALEKNRPCKEMLDLYSDVVAVGTIADVMPLCSENRAIVSYGLKMLPFTKNPGLRALMQKLGLGSKTMNANSVSFVMAPRINAAGRLGVASIAARMFLTDDPEEASSLADELCELNRLRQDEENQIFTEITEKLKDAPELTHGKILVLWGENWHNGVIGIVSSRLSDRYGIPCILVSLDGDSGKGSGRSIKGFNLYAALEKSSGLLEKFGGHELAVGLSLDRSNLTALKEALEKYAEEYTSEVDISPSINVDCRVEASEITVPSIKGLSVLEPFGMGNPQPLFVMNDMRVEEITPISHERHIKLQLSKDGVTFYGFVFGMGMKSCQFVKGDKLDVAFSAEINNYRGRDSVQLVVKDLKWSESEEKSDSESYSAYLDFISGKEITPDTAAHLSPTKNELISVFRHIKANAAGSILSDSVRSVYRKIKYESQGSLSLGRFLVCMDVFSEFSIFSYSLNDDDISITVNEYEGKADINGSTALRRLNELRQR
ncbi:MAG: single-stranded-DNA-specific exonuclease RecJ [Clostridia bacterium]|nr:single-stranded-DNA-specific exonuclease RecJ [Clostridia bacterium]